MNALGWVLIASGAALLYAFAKGRIIDEDGNFVLNETVIELFTGLATGDETKLDSGTIMPGGIGAPTVPPEYSAIVAETPGDDTGASEPGSEPDAFAPAGSKGRAILAAAKRRGNAARGYRWAATGPSWYDCSGLVWRAIQDVDKGAKGLPRFIVGTMRVGGWRKRFRPVTTPVVGDIVYWGPNVHVGIVAGTDTFYSARNPRSGIGTSKISTFNRAIRPKYLRYVA